MVLVYEWYKDDLLQLITKHPNITLTSRKWMLREIGEALKDMHAKEWIDIGTNQLARLNFTTNRYLRCKARQRLRKLEVGRAGTSRN